MINYLHTLTAADIFLARPAQWHQWLRYVRPEPPTMLEQQQDLIRQSQMKELARLADERWASKPSFLDKPKTQQQNPRIDSTPNSQLGTDVDGSTISNNDGRSNAQNAATTETPDSKPRKEENPWAKTDTKTPGEGWQPDSWAPKSQR